MFKHNFFKNVLILTVLFLMPMVCANKNMHKKKRGRFVSMYIFLSYDFGTIPLKFGYLTKLNKDHRLNTFIVSYIEFFRAVTKLE